ncbi:MAG: PPC domain-containing protein, partial [Anaerolineae bacterium]
MQSRRMSITVSLVTLGIVVSGTHLFRARATVNEAPARPVVTGVARGEQTSYGGLPGRTFWDGTVPLEVPAPPLRGGITGLVPRRASAPSDCPIDGYEENDTFGAAYGPISPGIAHCGAYICPSGDVDWYKFTVVSEQEITLDLDSLPADFDLRLYDPSGTLIDESASGGTFAEQIVHTAGMTGDYRAYVFGYDGAYSEDDYCLSVTLSEEPTPTPTATPTPTSTPSCPSDGYEENDTFGAAYGPISPG